MITVTKDGELMTNYVTINPVPADEVFGAFTDHEKQPAVMSLSEDSILYLVISNGGKVTRIDFGRSSGIVKGERKVLAFAVQQSLDGTLDICMAVDKPTSGCRFYLLHAIRPEDLLQPIPPSKIIEAANFPIVAHIYMGNKSTAMSQSLPLVMVAFVRPDRITKTEELNFVEFKGKEAKLNGNWTVPADPERILAVELGTVSTGDGAFILYEGQSGKKHLLFQSFTGSVPFAVQPVCPEGAVGLTTFLDTQTQETTLIVAGDKIAYFLPRAYLSPKGIGTVIDNLEHVPGMKDIHCSQSQEDLRLWYTTVDDALYYYTTTTSDLSEGVNIPLLTEGQGGRASGLLCAQARDDDSDLLVSSLLSVDQDANIYLLQQDSASKAWQRYPFWFSSEKNVKEVEGYMLRFQVVQNNDPEDPNNDDEGEMIVGSWLYVTCSGLVRCFINGKPATMSPAGDWYQTDVKGVLNVLLQTEDATCHQFAVQRYRPVEIPGGKRQRNSERLIEDPVLDPSEKVVGRLKNIQTEDDLRALRRQDGTPLIGPGVPDGDVIRAAQAFQQLSERADEIHLDQKQKLAAYRLAVRELKGQASGGEIVPFGFFDDAWDWLTGAWNWVEDKVKDAIDWGVKLVGDVWKFIVKIGEEIFEIALTTITSIVKGIVWVFKKVGAFIKDVIEFLGFLFGWGDILDTTDSIVAGLNAALDHGKSVLESQHDTVHGWLEDLRETLKEQLPILHDTDYTAVLKNQELAKLLSGSSKLSDDDETKQSVVYNWSAYNFTYGGGTTSAVLHDDSMSRTGTEDELLRLWDTVVDQLEAITKTVVKVAKEFVDFFKPGHLNVNTLINKVGTILIDELVDALERLADIIFYALSTGISIIKDIGNKKIDIPIISWVWEKIISRGRPLTLLNFCALLIAIPTTILYKATTKSAPPKLSGRVTKDTFAQHVTGKGSATLSKDITNFALSASSGLELVSEEFSTLGLLADGTFEGLGLEGISVGFIGEFMNVFDSATLAFEAVGGFVEWPVIPDETTAEDTRAFDLAKFNKYSGWALKGAGMGSSVIIKVVAKAKKAPRPVVKRWKATVGAAMSVPKLCLSLTNGIQDAKEGEKSDILIVNGFLKGGFTFGKQWGESVAAWNNQVENELMYAGLVVKQICAIALYGLKIVDFGVGIIE
ncbi:hypothetical protein F9C07_2285063 [Aspergillus flavus]|uniref:Uncharacterized protein n=1 Tax=Aspergillus flavus (strain ATCC 200026 / FGSC A1120 / IAM 13836 / NRRL 3357 / JCM 12722 / SRRC 167) TaxID=332952 RepID=A0A7U2MIR7_ASPFN|nr:uncharacterized protein G4B84_008321 [Aspergillus flavus NRRL3357]KAF7615700.1 hypothetical protein AFLA_009209 [Aspergillus flavus NRRL3357]QMW32890.1 hypothetical protein G4B84_008321 [Aspergillus flavus NRRL3357]QRD84423.1 hypothetical protein F9C07_2285063 [Aspergillus flavus]